MRLFVAVDLDDALVEPFETLQASLREASGLRFTDPTQAHLTLKFLGEVEGGRVDEVIGAIGAAVDEVDVEPFEATVGGLGAFPHSGYIRVIWVGVRDGANQFAALHEAIEESTVDRGFSPESNAFTPHVTLARMQHAGGKALVQEALDEGGPTLGTMWVDEVRLKRSVSTGDGPTYTTLARFRLGG